MSGVKLEDLRIPLDEIRLGTNNFSAENYIGGGGFGKVYKGKIFDSGSHVAVKRLDPKSLQGKHEFLNEVSMLFSYQHENIITFIGYCDEGHEMIVVYEYAINQSLDKYLYDTNKMSCMSWEQRLKICIGAAKGLDYLHSGLGEHHRIIHRDIKSANILLDENWVAKISDFGLSRIGPKDLPYTQLVTKVAGTLGYCDPSYIETDVLRKESDIYSFGVVLFEMLCGRLVYKKRCNAGDEPQNLVEWVRCCYKDGGEKIIDPHIKDQIKSDSLDTFKKISYLCLKIKVHKRPTMATIIEKLEEALEFQVKLKNSSVEEIKRRIKAHQQAIAAALRFKHAGVQPSNLTNSIQPDSSASGDELVEHEENGIDTENNVVNKEELVWPEPRFEIEDLLRASAEVVGRGILGNTYKALVEDGSNVVAVKRLTHTSQWSKTEFVQKCKAIVDQKHTNLLPLLAYYFSSYEKLLVYKFVANGNLLHRLHGERGKTDRLLFIWDKRLSVAVGVARALDYLHKNRGLQEVPHGNLKSSNVLLDENDIVLVCDYGLTSIISDPVLIKQMVSFKSPEGLASKRLTRKTDVWCYGVLLLELLTGIVSSNSAPEGEKAMELYSRASMALQEGKTAEIFDAEIMEQGSLFDLEGMLTLLQIAIKCCDNSPKRRPKMTEVLREVENIKAIDENSESDEDVSDHELL